MTDGKVPFRDWMTGMKSHPVYEKIVGRLERVEEGNFGEHRSVGEGVSELVINFGPGYRVYYGLDGPSIVILLAGGSKATQHPRPARDGAAVEAAEKPSGLFSVEESPLLTGC